MSRPANPALKTHSRSHGGGIERANELCPQNPSSLVRHERSIRTLMKKMALYSHRDQLHSSDRMQFSGCALKSILTRNHPFNSDEAISWTMVHCHSTLCATPRHLIAMPSRAAS